MNTKSSSEYFNNKLTAEEEQAFEQQLHQDMIKNRYEQLLIQEGLYVPKETFMQVVHRKTLPALKVAAVFLVVTMAGWRVWQFNKPLNVLNSEANLQQYLAQTAEIPQTRMGITTNKEQNWVLFKQAYSVKDYQKAILLMRNIEPKDQDDLYYLGLCYLYQSDNQYITAIGYLKEALNLGKKEAAWYLSLAQYKHGDKEAARQSLQQFLAFDIEWKRQEAENLLKTL